MAKQFDKQWYPFYHDLFNRSTAGWTAERVGAYILLLNHQWQNNGIPNDREELLLIAKCKAEILDKVLLKFEVEKQGRIFNKKMEIIRKEQERKYLISKAKADKANAIMKEKRKEIQERSTLRSTYEQRNVNDTHKEEEEDISKDIIKGGDLSSKKNKREVKIFTKPEWKDVANYWLKYLPSKGWSWNRQKIQDEAENFIDHYKSNNWMVGKNKMQDWEASARNWAKNNNKFEFGNDLTNQSQQPKKFLGED